MKNKIAKLAMMVMAILMTTACGSVKKTTDTTQPNTPSNGQGTQTTTVTSYDAIIATLGNWQTLQTGGNITLKAGSSFSSSIQVRMLRNEAIFISLRPVLGIEVGWLLITADSLYAVDKVHKRIVAEKVSLLTAGIPVTVSDVQDIFLGRPFIIGKGTLNEGSASQVNVSTQGNKTLISPNESYKGYMYTFKFDDKKRIMSLDIMPQGNATAAYQVKYSDVKPTAAGNVAHSINVNATVEKKKLDFSLSYKNIEWNGNVKIDKSIPNGYSRMNARDLFSLFN